MAEERARRATGGAAAPAPEARSPEWGRRDLRQRLGSPHGVGSPRPPHHPHWLRVGVVLVGGSGAPLAGHSGRVDSP